MSAINGTCAVCHHPVTATTPVFEVRVVTRVYDDGTIGTDRFGVAHLQCPTNGET